MMMRSIKKQTNRKQQRLDTRVVMVAVASTLEHTLKWTGLVTSGERLLVGSGNRQKVNKPFIEDHQKVGMKVKDSYKV